jgi:hypothetical protein
VGEDKRAPVKEIATVPTPIVIELKKEEKEEEPVIEKPKK